MKIKNKISFVLLFCIIMFTSTLYAEIIFKGISTLTDVSNYQHEKAREIVTKVIMAKNLIEEEGTKAFSEIRKINSTEKTDSYIMVITPEGKVEVHIDPTEENRNRMNLTDEKGSPIVKLMIYEALHGGGWLHYHWEEKDSFTTKWKSVFVLICKAPDGKEYIVAAGGFELPGERLFVMDQVEDFAGEFEKNGSTAFVDFKNKSTNVVNYQTYIYVINSKGVELFNPVFPVMEGRNLYNYRDPAGQFIVRMMIDALKNKNTAWVKYLWKNPDTGKMETKESYIRKVKYGKKFMVLGAGFFPHKEL